MPPLRLARLAVAFLFVASAASAQLVERVIDGDTIVVQGIGTVRLIGVDTPETVDPRRPVQYFGKEASDFTRRLATRQVVRLEFDGPRTDRYRRTLAYVYLPDGTLLNAEIVRQGYGHAYTQFPFRYLEDFRGYERQAGEAGRGLWGNQDTTARAPAVQRAAAQASCVNINTADATALEPIIHIGPARAQQIIALRRQRPFRSVNELIRVNGIGAARLRDILAQDVACVG
jgi:endonuclease YncB( thermonuclease family)